MVITVIEPHTRNSSHSLSERRRISQPRWASKSQRRCYAGGGGGGGEPCRRYAVAVAAPARPLQGLLQSCARAADEVQVVRRRCASSAWRALLCAADDAGRAADSGGDWSFGDVVWVPAHSRDLDVGAGGGVEGDREGCARQGRRFLLPDMARGPSLTYIISG